MPNEKTGNRKCWYIQRSDHATPSIFTKSEAERLCREVNDGSRACLDGHHFVPCDGEAHSNPHIDHCSLCAPHWGVVMVPDESP